MVKKKGFIIYDEDLKNSFIDYSYDYANLPNSIKEKLEYEIINIAKNQKQKAFDLIEKYKDFIIAISDVLFEKEIILEQDINVIALNLNIKKNDITIDS